MLVSFVIPSKNSVIWLTHAIDSVFNQTYENIELVVVNDGSNDSTKDFLDKLSDSNKYTSKMEDFKERFKDNLNIIHTNGVGRAKARNMGNKAARGEIIFVLDADDYASPDRVKKTLSKFKNGVEFVYGSAETMDFSGTRGIFLKSDVLDRKKVLDSLYTNIVHSSVAYTKKIANLYPYSEQKEISDLEIDDWEQQMRIIFNGVKTDFIPTTIVAYRILENSISHTRDQKVVEEFKKKYMEQAKICV